MSGAPDGRLPSLIPSPASLEFLPSEPLVLDGGLAVVHSSEVDERLGRLVSRLLTEAGAVDRVGAGGGRAAEGSPVRLDLDPTGGVGPEGYSLRVDAAGATITASAGAGLFYGAQTLAQLVSSAVSHRVPAARVDDAPRFAYRGAMLDVARHFFDVATVEAFIDRIALAKLNHLHLHLTDDQGWRIHIDSWPLLTGEGASGGVDGSPGGFYTHADYARIVAYAAERFVTIVPEIDLPGHTHAALVAYPELAPAGYAGAPGAEVAAAGGRSGFPPYDGTEVGFSTLDPRSDLVHGFVSDVLREVSSLTPGPYLHLGGDESLATTEEEYIDFLHRATDTAGALGKTLVLWHEAGIVPGLPRGTIGQYWDYVEPRGTAGVVARRFADGGGALVLSPSDAAYVDMKHAADDALGLDWADGPTSVERAYHWEPTAVVPGVGAGDILGVEAPLWSETIDSLAGIDALAFPRLLALAEIGWSPRADDSADRTWESFRRRLAGWQPRLDALGVGYTRADGIDWR